MLTLIAWIYIFFISFQEGWISFCKLYCSLKIRWAVIEFILNLVLVMSSLLMPLFGIFVVKEGLLHSWSALRDMTRVCPFSFPIPRTQGK